MKKLLMLTIGIGLILAGCTKATQTNNTTDTQAKTETKEEKKEEEKEEKKKEKKEEKTEEPVETSSEEQTAVQPEETVITVEDVIQNPEAYVNTYVHIRGNFPQALGGVDEDGNMISFFTGANDLSQHIRIVNFVPQDGACLVEATGTIVYLDNGDLAISMDGYTLL